MLELSLALSVMLIPFLAFSQSLGTSMRLTETNRETALATDAVREMVELLSGVEDFTTVFARYNEDPDDDPDGPGTAPGPNFVVAGLAPLADDADGFVGRITFPVVGAELHENVVEPALGMPRDLDGDGFTDSDDHRTDYRLLPVLVTLEWEGAGGARTVAVPTLIADR